MPRVAHSINSSSLLHLDLKPLISIESLSITVICETVTAREREMEGERREREALVTCSDKSMKTGITIWDVETGERIMKIPSCAATIHGLLCLRNQYIVASQANRHGSVAGGSILMWPLNKPHPPLQSYTMEALGPISCSKDGVYLAGGSPSGNLYLWEAVGGRLLNMWRGHHKSLKCIVFSDDGSILISGSDDGMLCVWSMIRKASNRSLSILHYSLEHQSSITGLLTVPSSRSATFVSSSLDGTCKIWGLVSGELLQTKVYPQALTAIVLHPVKLLLFSGSLDGIIFVSRLHIGPLEDPFILDEDQPTMLKGHNAAVTALTISSSYLISASEDNTFCLWDITSGMIIRKFNHQKGPVTNLVVIPPSSLLAYTNHHHGISNRFRVSLLEKYPQPENSSKNMIALLHSCFSSKDEELSVNLQRTKSFHHYMLELQQGKTPAAIQMKVQINRDYRKWVTQMTNHVMEMNKHIQSRLLDMMECRILWLGQTNTALNEKRKKLKIENRASMPVAEKKSPCRG